MAMGLHGKSALICASSKGLGFTCAAALARENVHVYLNGREQAALESAAHRLKEDTGAAAEIVVADIGTPAGRDACFAACPDPDIVVNNNGGPPPRVLKKVSRADIDRAMTMNMLAPFEIMQRAAAGMARRKFGRIVNITSVSVALPHADLEASSAARAALTAFAVGMARTYAPDHVTINNLLPGFFATERLLAVFELLAVREQTSVEEVRKRQQDAIPTRRFGDPQEFGAFCAFLCSVQASYITGQNIVIDGGLFARNF